MDRFILLLTLISSVHLAVFGQSDQELIQETLYDFIDGTVYNYPDTIASAFYPDTRMFLYNGTDSAFTMTSEEYAALYSRQPPGTKNDRINHIVGIDIEKDVAFAKLQVIIPSLGNRYHDLLLLKKIRGQWKIVAKCTSAEPIPRTAREMIPHPTKEVVIDGLRRPWSMAFLSEEEVLIAEKDGELLRVNLATRQRQPIRNLPDDVAKAVRVDTTQYARGVFPGSAHGTVQRYNAGLFQVLLDPDYPTNGYVYLSYSAENEERNSATKVIRGRLSGNELTEVETIFVAAPYSPGLFHYGGGMVFGPDDKLYITLGERNFFEYLNPEIPLSQDVSDRRGKVVRLNPDGTIPDDNPDFGPDAVPGLYATGIRAAQGLAVDPATGKIWLSEHGTMQGDELNILSAGANYGWPNRTTGRYRSADYTPPEKPEASFTEPVYFWEQTVAPTGLAFYTGREFPQWEGNLLVPGLSRGSLWRMTIAEGSVVGVEELFVNDRVRLRKAIVSPRGQLYLLTDEENGKLLRVKNCN